MSKTDHDRAPRPEASQPEASQPDESRPDESRPNESQANESQPGSSHHSLRFSYLIVAAFLVACAGAGYAVYYFYFKSDQSESATKSGRAAVVTATEAREVTWTGQLTAVGTITPVQGTELTAESAGKVETILFRSGQRVEKGQLLVELDASSELAELKSLLPQLRQAKSDQERAKELIDDGAISEEAFEEAFAQVDRLQAAIEQRQAIIDRKEIRAPFSGELGIRMVNLGQYVSPGTAVVSLQKISPIYVDFDVPEQVAAEVAERQIVRASVTAYPERTWKGEITAITPLIESATRSIQVRAELPNDDQQLQPGMFADVVVELPESRRVVTVPQTAVALNAYGTSLFVVKEDGEQLTVRRKFVETGDRRGLDIEIAEGVKAGERVVTAGQLKISDGDPVTISEEDLKPRQDVSQPDQP